MARPLTTARAVPDPDRPGFVFRPCSVCERKVHAREGKPCQAMCTPCRKAGNGGQYNTRARREESERNPAAVLAERTTTLRMAIVDAIHALEKDKPAVALARLQEV